MNNSVLNNELIGELDINPKDVDQLLNNYNYSSKNVCKLKEEISKQFPSEISENFCIFLVGSYGRLEASPNSDLDCIFIYKNSLKDSDKEKICTQIFRIANEIGIVKTPGDTGTFKEFVQLDTLLKNIGGFKDTNKNLTRRILILVESRHLYNEDLCKEVVSKIFNEYTTKSRAAEKDPRVLINELVRYYRTITIDYRYKTEEGSKAWGVRNIKLRHSRKLLFFTSIAIIFTAMKKFNRNSFEDKYNYIIENINSPPILKLRTVLVENNKSSSLEPFIYYNKFLKFISDEKKLKELNNLDYDERHTNTTFLDFKDNSDRFDKSLKDLIKSIDDWDDLFYKYIIF